MTDTLETSPQGQRTPPKVPRPEPAPIVPSPAIDALRQHLLLAVDPELELQRFRKTHQRTPLVETCGTTGERIVTFLWRDEQATEVLLFVNRVTDERNLEQSLMQRLEGTDLWHLSYRMRADWRASYCFLIKRPGQPWPWEADGGDQVRIRLALDRGLADPLNPNTNRNRVGTLMSVVELPDAPPQPWRQSRVPAPQAGALTELIAPDGRTVWVYLGPGAAEGTLLPVVIVLDGDAWVGPRGGRDRGQDLPTTLDNLIADGALPPCAALFVDSGGRDRRWAEMSADGGQSAWIVDRLLPWVRLHFPVSSAPSEVVVAGQSLGGYMALRTALERPEAVGCALAQSPSLWQRELVMPEAGTSRLPKVYLEVGSQEWVLRDPARRLAAALQHAGAPIRFFEFNGGHDYACWRGGIADGLRALLSGDVAVDKINEWNGDGTVDE